MKKIVGILCAAAMFTASVFAADVAVVSRFEGTLFNYSKADKVRLLELHDGAEHWYADLAVATWGEQAGATITYSTGLNNDVALSDAESLFKGRMMMYFKPFEGLELKLGFVETSLHVEHIEWYRTIGSAATMAVNWARNYTQRVSGYGYAAVYVNGPFGVELFLNPAGNYWFTDAVKGNNLWTKLWFGTDAGTFGLTFNAGNNFDTGAVVIGWDKSFGNLNIWVDAGVSYNKDGAEWAGLCLDINGSVDSFTHETYIDINFRDVNNIDLPDVLFWGKYSIALDAVTAYIKIEDDSVLSPAMDGGVFAATVNPGIAGNFGGMSWDVGIKVGIVDSDVSLSIPFSTQINF